MHVGSCIPCSLCSLIAWTPREPETLAPVLYRQSRYLFWHGLPVRLAARYQVGCTSMEAEIAGQLHRHGLLPVWER